MHSRALGHALLFTSLSAFATLGGGAITKKLVDWDAAVSFVILGMVVCTLIFIGTLVLQRFAPKRLILEYLSVSVGCISLSWIMLCLALPLLWLYGFYSPVGSALSAFFLLTLSYSLFRGHAHFVSCWKQFGEVALGTSFDRNQGTLDRFLLAKKLELAPDLFLPAPLEKLRWIILPALVLSMVTGLNLRNAFPVFSALAWGIPALVIASVGLQMAFLFALQALKIIQLEKEIGKRIRPMSTEDQANFRRMNKRAKSKVERL